MHAVMNGPSEPVFGFLSINIDHYAPAKKGFSRYLIVFTDRAYVYGTDGEIVTHARIQFPHGGADLVAQLDEFNCAFVVFEVNKLHDNQLNKGRIIDDILNGKIPEELVYSSPLVATGDECAPDPCPTTVMDTYQSLAGLVGIVSLLFSFCISTSFVHGA